MRTRLLAFLLLVIGLPATAPAQTDYNVGANDVLTIVVFGEPEFSGKYTVDQDGTFTFPQLGRVKAGGATLRGLEQELKKQLADGYLKNPQVSVSIETYRSQRILIMGEVRSPGEYQLAGETRLLAALARAGSTTPTAGQQVLVIHGRRNRGTAAPLPARSLVTADEADLDVTRIDLAELQAGNMGLNVILEDGDTINVPKAQSVFVSGQVKAPGAYAIEPGSTLLQVLSLAGGLTERGSDSRVRLIRTVNGKRTEVKAKLTDIVQPGDTIVVPERFF